MHTFIEIDDKGGEIVQRYESFGRDWTWTWIKREQHRGIEEDQKFLDKKST